MKTYTPAELADVLTITVTSEDVERTADHDALREPDVLCPICDSWMGGQCGHGPADGWKEWAEGFDPDHRTNLNIPPPVEAQPEPPAPYEFDLPPFTDAEATALAERLLVHAAKIEALQSNTAMLVAEQQRFIDAILAEEEYRIRHWISSGDPKAKSRRTIYGLLGTRKKSGGLEMVDEKLALESVREMCPGAIREVEVIDRGKLPDNFTAPGFDFTPPASKLYFAHKPKGGKNAKGAPVIVESEDDDDD